MQVRTIRTGIFELGGDLNAFLKAQDLGLQNGDILIVTSKIVALAQGRVVARDSISKRDLVVKEADRVLFESKKTMVTLKDGILIAASGIDESNARENYILWPSDAFSAARDIWKEIRAHFGLTRLGIILSDSRSGPLRTGVLGIALAYWGFQGVDNHVDKPDLFGRPMVVSQTNVADSLAGAAVLLMGEAAEQTPLAVISEFHGAVFTDTVNPRELLVAPAEDIFAPFWNSQPR